MSFDMFTEVDACRGTGDFDPPDADYEDFEDEEPVDLSFVWRRDRKTGVTHLVPLDEARCDAMGTLLYPWSWIGLLAAGQIVTTPDALIGTDYLTIARCRL